MQVAGHSPAGGGGEREPRRGPGTSIGGRCGGGAGRGGGEESGTPRSRWRR